MMKKKNLEQFRGSLFTALDGEEQLGFTGGATGGPTKIITGSSTGLTDVLLDFRVDPV